MDRSILKNVDLVLLTDLLEHVSDDHAMVSEIVDNIRAQTYVLITVPAYMKLW